MSLASGTQVHEAGFTATPLDEDGFLLDRRHWNPELARQLASDAGVGPLGASHMLLIDFVRDRYYRLGAVPPMRNLCRRIGVDRDAVIKHFGTCCALWRIAGLPNPGTEATSHMD